MTRPESTPNLVREPPSVRLLPADIRAGYRFWGAVVVLILVVELAGAVRDWLKKHVGATIPWTTISGMVGHLEELWPTTAVVVVAIIAPAAFYALAPRETGRRSALGRRYLRKPPTTAERRYKASLVFFLSAVAGIGARFASHDDFVRAYVIYGALFFFGVILPSFLVLLLKKEVGFTSLFVTINQLRASRGWKASLATVAISAGLAILVIHLAFYPWPDITKEPVRYAGLTEKQARSKAVEKVMQLRGGATDLVYSAQARGVVRSREAWVVYFSLRDGSDSGCVVIVKKEVIDTTRECSAQ